MRSRIEAIAGDITTLEVAAIVNAANSSLLGGGGVDGAIHRGAGPELLEECRLLGGCQPGEAKITKGYLLPARFVIHTVGPIYGAHNGQEATVLADCYLNSLRLAEERALESIAFPAISTGVYGYPKDEAAHVSIGAIRRYFEDAQSSQVHNVTLVSFSDIDQEIIESALSS